MLRRSRLSVRPNVGTAGRTAGSPQETLLTKDQEDDANTGVETPVSVSDNTSADPPTEQTPGIDQNGEAPSSSAIQRRKRFSVRPKVVPGRPSALPRTAKPSIKPVLPTVKSPASVIDKAETLIEVNSIASHQELQTPKERQPANESRLSKTDAASPSGGSSECIDQHGKAQSSLCSQVKETSSKTPVPHSLPDREAIAISEKAKTLVSRTELKAPSQNFSLTQLLNDKSDLLRLEKARKLRQLLKQEMLKEKSKKCMARVKECTLDPAKMTMRDLIHYLPTSNPMSSTVEDSVQENENAIPQSPDRETSPERPQEQEVHPKLLSPDHGEATATTSVEGHQAHEEEAGEAEEEAEEAEEAAEDEDALMVPQVKVAEDGSLIIDEESLTVEVQRMKGPNTIQDRDPIFERGSTTTYSSFRKGTHTKPWSTEETDMFFLAISMVGTDFAMISQLFPHRARSEIKNKFKKEERCNAWRIDKAFRERRKLDLEYFKKLLEKIIEFQQNKKKLKSMSEKPKTSKRKAKGKKAVVELSDVEEVNEDGVSIEQQEGEKENLCNEKTSSSKTKCKNTRKDVLSPESPVDKKRNKRLKKLSDDAGNHADLVEVAIPEEHLSLALSNKTETQAAKTADAKSGKPRSFGRKGLKATKSKAVVSDTEGDTTSEETERQIKIDSLSSQQSAKRLSDNDSSDHETTLPSARPSRYGRISKPVQPLNYPAKEDTNTSASDTLASPAHQTAAAAKAKNKTLGKRKSAKQKMSKESKKPKLITLRASQSEGSDDDEEETDAQHYDDENSTNAFVPASLCSPKPVVPEVQETMEEDVIDFLSEHAEEDDEAAQTLLEIGNPANLSQPTESQPSSSGHISKFESSHCSEMDDFFKSSFDQEECTELVSETSKTKNIPTKRTMEQPPTSFTSDTPSGELSDTGSSTHILTPRAKNSMLARKGRLSKIKPKPNVGSSTRTTKLLTQTIGADVKSPQDAANSQHQSLGQLEESTLAVYEPSKTDSGPADDTILVMPTSHVSNAQVSSEPCCKPDTVDSLQLQTTLEPKMNPSAPMRQILPRIKPNIGCASRTTKPTVEAVDEENPQVKPEKTLTTKLGSLEYQEESTLAVSEQDESCSTQRAAVSQLESLCAKNSSAPRRGRLSKIKPKPNVQCASRTSKLPSQTVHDIEENLEDKLEMASTSQLKSSEHCVESTQIASEQSICLNEITDSTTEYMPASQTTDTQVIKHQDEPSTTEGTAATSELETACSKNSSAPRKGRCSKIKPKPKIESASRMTKQPLQSVDAAEHTQSVSETAPARQRQSVAPPLSKSFVGPQLDFHQESHTLGSKGTEANQRNRFALTHSEISGPQERGEEPSTPEERVGQCAEMSCAPSAPCTVEPPERVENITPLEPKIVPSAQTVPASAQETTENLSLVQLSDPSSESLKHSTPQRRRWVPKFKPKPNLLSSPRTPKSRLESEEMTQASHKLVKSSLLNAKSEQPMLQDCSSAKPHDHLQSVNLEPNSSSSVPSTLAISLGEEMTNVSKMDCAPNRTKTDHCNPMESAPSDSSKTSKTLPQLKDLKNTEICLVGDFKVETSGISADNVQPAEGAVVPSTELQHNEAAPLLSQDQVKDSSLQKLFESPLFPNIPPDQVPSDPDEPFFILSLTEIPVCPSVEEVDPRPESYHAVPNTEAQQSNPVEFVVPLADGIDDSLSNIHIPTPEKATFNSRVICVEEYLPSAPSVDISILEEPQENTPIQRLNSPEAKSNFDLCESLLADKQPSIRSDVKKCSRRPNLMRKTAAEKTNKPENTTQDPSKPFTQMESSDGTSVIGEIRTYETRKNKSQTKNSKAPLWGGTETQSSKAPTADVWTSSFSSELISPKQRHSTNTSDEKPTKVSESSIGDVSNEVESASSVTGPTTGDTACHDKTTSQLAEIKTKPSQNRDSPCGQQSPITAAPQTPEAMADEAAPSYLPCSSTTETTVHSSQLDNKTSRGRRKGNAHEKIKTSGDTKAEHSRPQRKSTTYFPESGNLEKSSSSSSTIPPQTHETNQLSRLQNASEILNLHQSDSIGSSSLEEEPTNVSQYFFKDVFTEVESEGFPFTGKSDRVSSCSGTAPSQRAETEVDESLKRNASGEPLSGQHSSLTEGQSPDVTSSTISSIDVTMTDSSQRNTKKTRGKGSSKNNTICQSLRKSTDASKTPEAVLRDSLKETRSTSSAARPQDQRGSSLASIEAPVDKNDSIVEVDCGNGSVTKTVNSDDACGDKTQTQSLEMRGNTKKRKAKASSGFALIQETAHEASVSHAAQKTTFDSSQKNIGKTRGSVEGKNKASDEATTKRSRTQRQDTAASKSPIYLSASAPMLQATNQSDSKESCLLDDEPTNVSQYFLSDIFTDVDEEFMS